MALARKATLAAFVALAYVVTTCHGDDGRIEISQNMIPLTIDTPGSYIVVEDLAHTNAGDGIKIETNNVTLDLNGFRLFGGASTVSDDGISIPFGRNIEVRNGTVSGFGGNGIDASNTINCVFRDLRLIDNYHDGIRIGRGSLLIDTVAGRNGVRFDMPNQGAGVGIRVLHGTLVKNCTAYGSLEHGIVAASAAAIIDSILQANRHDGIHGGQGVLFRGINSYGNVGEGFEIEGGSIVAECVVAQNIDDGIKSRSEGRTLFARCVASDTLHGDGVKAREGSLVVECTAYENYGDGVVTAGASYTRDCLGYGNSLGSGVYIENSQDGRCDDNHVLDNEHGVKTEYADCLILGNRAAGNSIDYDLDSGTLVDLETGSPNAAGPWTSFDY